MPTYDYECQTCGHQFEAKQSMKDPHLTDCPQQDCAGPVKRKMTDFPRTLLKTYYLQKEGEPLYHLVNERFDYDRYKL